MRAIFYDTETTGISPKKDRIVEIAAYDPEKDCSFVQLVNPGMPIPSEASAIHKISDEMVANEPTIEVVLPKFVEFCSGDVVLIAHNNDNFDIHFLRNEFERSELTMPTWRFFDTLKWSRKYRPDLPRHSLQFLREMYKIPANNAHRAFDDVIVLWKVFKNMVDDLSISQAFALMQQKATLTRMPFGKHRGMPLEQVPGSYYSWLLGSGALDKTDNEELKNRLQELGLLPS